MIAIVHKQSDAFEATIAGLLWPFMHIAHYKVLVKKRVNMENTIPTILDTRGFALSLKGSSKLKDDSWGGVSFLSSFEVVPSGCIQICYKIMKY